MSIWVVFIVSLVAATVITNSAQQLFMRIIGADAMFFSGKKKLIAIIFIALLLSTFLLKMFNIEIPK